MTTAQIAAILIAVIVGAVVKSVTGMGLPLIAVPIITVFAGAETAVAILAIPNTVQNLTLVVRNRRSARSSTGLASFSAAGIAGAIIGTLLLGAVPEWVISLALAVLVSAYLVSATVSPDLQLPSATARRWSPAVGGVSGVFLGASGVSGPLVATWFHALRLERGAFVFSIALVFLLSGAAQAVVLAQTGLLDGRLAISAVLTVIVLGTIPLGPALSARLSSRGFERAVRILLAASVVALLAELAIRVIGR